MTTMVKESGVCWLVQRKSDTGAASEGVQLVFVQKSGCYRLEAWQVKQVSKRNRFENIKLELGATDIADLGQFLKAVKEASA